MRVNVDRVVPDAPAPRAASREWGAALMAGARDNRLVILVLTCFALTPLLVPLLTPVSIGDDWVYVRSVEILVREGRLHRCV